MRIFYLHIPGARLAALIIIALSLSVGLPMNVSAQSKDIIWTPQVNLSNSPGMTSSDPFLLSDPAGIVHLFWAEKISVMPGNVPDTVMYSQWDGQTWSQPLDIYFAPTSDGNLVINFPHAVLDNRGVVHLIWLSQPNFPYYSLIYGSASASQAKYVQSWSSKKILAEDLSGTEYSIHIALDEANTLHVAYASGITGETSTEERGVKYLRSTDDGLNWSEPVSIFTVPNQNWGASNVRIITAPNNRVFASWTVWDESGNGLAIYFARSLDNGLTWDDPVLLAQSREEEYERDWNGLLVLPDKRLMAMWEGGYRAYRNVMYSNDDGASWTEPVDLFPNLIGENGFVEFAYDGSGLLHLFVAQRIREGSEPQRGEVVEGLWHSVWDRETSWTSPVLVGGINPMVNPKVAIVRGNRIVTVWYSTREGEIITMTGEIPAASEVVPQPWSEGPPVLRSTPEASQGEKQTDEPVSPGGQPTDAIPTGGDLENIAAPSKFNSVNIVYLGAVPSVLLIAVIAVIRMLKHRN